MADSSGSDSDWSLDSDDYAHSDSDHDAPPAPLTSNPIDAQKLTKVRRPQTSAPQPSTDPQSRSLKHADTKNIAVPTSRRKAAQPEDDMQTRVKFTQSTPPSATLSSLGHHLPRTRERIDIFLKREVEECQAIPFEAFVEAVLLVSPKDMLIVERQFSGASLESYPWVTRAVEEWTQVLKDPKSKEQDRYIPFAKLANTIIAVLREERMVVNEEVRLTVCRMDPQEISTRQPADQTLETTAPPRRKPDNLSLREEVAHVNLVRNPQTPAEIAKIDAALANPPPLPSTSTSKSRSTSCGPGIPTASSSIQPLGGPGAPCPHFSIAIGPNFTLEWNEVLCCWEFKVSGKCAFCLSQDPLPDKPFSNSFDNVPDDNMIDIDAPSDTAALRKDGRLQLASYALEALSHRGLRRHVIHCLIEGDVITLWFYDRRGIFVALPVPISKPGRLAVILYGMARLSPYNWGYYQNINFPIYRLLETKIPESLVGSTIRLPVNGDSVEFIFGVQIWGEKVITGRGTTVARISIAPGSPVFTQQSLVVKYGWPVVTRQSEVAILEYIRTSLWNTDDEYLLNHLPRIYTSHDYASLSEGPRATLYKRFNLEFKEDEDRLLRVMIMDELRPATELSPTEFVAAFRDAMFCCERLNLLLGVVHRDISLMNIMYRKITVDGVERIFGVLNDWDLAFVPRTEPDQGPTSKFRDGTLPYSSLSRLQTAPPESTFNQDLESFFWTLLIAATCVASIDVQRGPRAIISWFHQGIGTLRALKKEFLYDTMLHRTQQVYYKIGWRLVGRVVNKWGWKLAYSFTKTDRNLAKHMKHLQKKSRGKKSSKNKGNKKKMSDLTTRFKDLEVGVPLEKINKYFAEEGFGVYVPFQKLGPSLCY